MKVNLFVKIVLAVIAICLVSISLAVWTQTVVRDYFSITKVDNISYIPKEWGNLKAANIQRIEGIQGALTETLYLFFEAPDGTIYVVQGDLPSPSFAKDRGLYFAPKNAVKILREGVSVQPEKKEAPGAGF